MKDDAIRTEYYDPADLADKPVAVAASSNPPPASHASFPRPYGPGPVGKINNPNWHKNLKRGCGQEHRNLNGTNASLPDALWNDGDVKAKPLRSEQPVHRTIQIMAAEGYTIKEISAFVGRTPAMVSIVLRQPWARARMISDIKTSVSDSLKQFVESVVVRNIKEIDEMGRDEKIPASTRLAAKQELVNRFLGKPTQPVENKTVEPTKLTQEELDREAAKVLNQLGSASLAVDSASPPNPNPS